VKDQTCGFFILYFIYKGLRLSDYQYTYYIGNISLYLGKSVFRCKYRLL
jgi:hypothetical protein